MPGHAQSLLVLLAAAAAVVVMPGASAACPGEEAVAAARESRHAASEAYRLCQSRHPEDWARACDAAFRADQQASRAYAALLLWRAETAACAGARDVEGDAAAAIWIPHP